MISPRTSESTQNILIDNVKSGLGNKSAQVELLLALLFSFPELIQRFLNLLAAGVLWIFHQA